MVIFGFPGILTWAFTTTAFPVLRVVANSPAT